MIPSLQPLFPRVETTNSVKAISLHGFHWMMIKFIGDAPTVTIRESSLAGKAHDGIIEI